MFIRHFVLVGFKRTFAVLYENLEFSVPFCTSAIKMKTLTEISMFLVVLLLPNLSHGIELSQTMRYKIINGQVFVQQTTTEAPSFLETLFPFLGTSYQSSNPAEVDEAIINSVSGPPAPVSFEAGGILSLPSFSSYPQEGGMDMNQINSPYLPEDDGYVSSGSINHYQYAMPPMNGQNFQAYGSQNSIYSNQPYPSMSYSNAAPPAYPAGLPPVLTQKSRPFYQPFLDFFGWGSSSEEEETVGMLPSPTEILNMGSFPSNSIPQIPQNYGYQPAQARQSYVMNPYHKEGSQDEGQLTESQQPGEASDDDSAKPEEAKDEAGSASTESAKKIPCPKLGFWQWDGENCIAIGPIPAWGCKPNDLVMSGKLAICRNKVFFPYGLKNPMKR